MDPKVYGKLLTTHRRGLGDGVEALHGQFPPPTSGAPAKAPRWDLTDTEGYGGGNRFLWSLMMFSGYMSIYRRKKSVGGATRVGRAPRPCGPLEHPPTYFFLLYIPMYPENIISDHEKLFPPS